MPRKASRIRLGNRATRTEYLLSRACRGFLNYCLGRTDLASSISRSFNGLTRTGLLFWRIRRLHGTLSRRAKTVSAFAFQASAVMPSRDLAYVPKSSHSDFLDLSIRWVSLSATARRDVVSKQAAASCRTSTIQHLRNPTSF